MFQETFRVVFGQLTKLDNILFNRLGVYTLQTMWVAILNAQKQQG